MRRPLSETTLPRRNVLRFSDAVASSTGLITVGSPSFRHSKPVAGTGWFLVAKTDQREATANSQLITRLIALLTIGLILGISFFSGTLAIARQASLSCAVRGRKRQPRTAGAFGIVFRASPLPGLDHQCCRWPFVDVNTLMRSVLRLEA